MKTFVIQYRTRHGAWPRHFGDITAESATRAILVAAQRMADLGLNVVDIRATERTGARP